MECDSVLESLAMYMVEFVLVFMYRCRIDQPTSHQMYLVEWYE